MKRVIFTPISIEELANEIAKILINSINQKNEEISINSSNKEAEFLTRKETMELCKIKSLTTLWNWEQNGKLVPKMKAGRKPLYIRQDVIEFLKRRESG